MFSGIVEEVGALLNIEDLTDSKRLKIGCNLVLEDSNIGDSISVNGVCLTIKSKTNNLFEVDVIKETLLKSNLGDWEVGASVNLERALQYNQRIGGHLVQGHVDCVGEIVQIVDSDDWKEVEVCVSSELKKYLIYKGSVSIDGMSLTVSAITKGGFKVSLIPHTLEKTISSSYNTGSKVNIELDMVGKYIENFSIN